MVFNDMSRIDALILCGGKGKRLRPLIKKCPKPMANIAGRPFLDIIIGYLRKYGISRIILGVGYKSKVIKDHYSKKDAGKGIRFSEEKIPLGTGGGIKKARHLIKSSPFLVLNGDSFCKVSLDGFMRFHKEKKAIASVVVAKARAQKDCGVITIDRTLRITAFNEKATAGRSGFVNAGIYIFDKKIFGLMPDKKSFSLEKELMPNILGRKVYGYATNAKFIDIGTPERYKLAKKILKMKKEKL